MCFGELKIFLNPWRLSNVSFSRQFLGATLSDSTEITTHPINFLSDLCQSIIFKEFRRLYILTQRKLRKCSTSKTLKIWIFKSTFSWKSGTFERIVENNFKSYYWTSCHKFSVGICSFLFKTSLFLKKME